MARTEGDKVRTSIVVDFCSLRAIRAHARQIRPPHHVQPLSVRGLECADSAVACDLDGFPSGRRHLPDFRTSTAAIPPEVNPLRIAGPGGPNLVSGILCDLLGLPAFNGHDV